MDIQVDYLQRIIRLLASEPSLNDILSYEINDDEYHDWQRLKEKVGALTTEETRQLRKYQKADEMVDEAFSNAYAEIQRQEPCVNDVFERVDIFLKSRPSVQEIMDYKVDHVDEYRFKYLFILNEANLSTLKQELELDRIHRANHLMMIAKADAWKAIRDEAA